MNILIPMVGLGTRFKKKYKKPKPLIDFLGSKIFEHSVNTLGIDGNFIFIVLKYEDEKYNSQLIKKINQIKPNSTIIVSEYPTEGATSSCLLASDYIDNEEPLIIANCDHFLNWDSKSFLNYVTNNGVDGCVTIYEHKNIMLNEKSPYSFAKINDDGVIIEMKEKFAISNLSLNGIHYWKKGSDFVRSGKKMIRNGIKTNNEFYISETYNYLITEGKKMTTFKMNKDEFFSLGTPEDLNNNKNKIKQIIKTNEK